MLMLGSGVGYNIQREYVNKLPSVREDFLPPVRKDESSASFIVPDSREGWVQLLERTLRGAFTEQLSDVTYSCQLVRGKGAPIKGFGGVASGPEDLVRGVGQISRVLESRRGQQLRPIDCLDIMNIIGSVVVAGNVRRSAQIAIGDYDDLDFLRAKRWDLGNIPSWRAMSNNSIVCNGDIRELPEEFWEGYRGNGEPYGLINLALSRSVGRLGEYQYPDPRIMGYNPCAEQSLEPYETCCLAEIFLPRIDSYDEFVDLARLLYRINKHSLALPCHHRETQEVVWRNMRMGIGVTGYLQSAEEQRRWLKTAYKELRKYDVEYSQAKGFPTSIKLTTMKPSGTLSLLPGVTPGVHPGYARHMIRRIRIAADNALVDTVRNHGYNVEYQQNFDGTEDHSTVVVEFPFSYPEGTVLAKDLTAIDQLEYVKRVQTEWSDNSVSCTVYYKLEELDDIRKYLEENYSDNFKSLSFLLHSDHGFLQAPYEEITEDQYNEMVSNTRIITSVEGDIAFEAGDDCAGGMCPIK